MRLSPLFFLVIIAGACKPPEAEKTKKSPSAGKGANGSKSGIVSEGFLTAKELAPPSLISSLTKDEVVTKLNEESERFMMNSPDGEETEQCFADFYDKNMKISGSNGNVIVSLDAELPACLKNSFESNGNVTLKTAFIKSFLKLSCDVDFSKFTGMKWSETMLATSDGDAECPSGQTYTLLSQIELEIKYAINDAGKTVNAAISTISHEGNDNGGPCELMKGSGTSNSCVAINSTTTLNLDEAGLGSGEYLKTKSNGLAYDDSSDAMWYLGGINDVVLNDWKGTVTYSSGTAAPTYKLVGPGGEVAEGTISGAATLRLTSSNKESSSSRLGLKGLVSQVLSGIKKKP